MLTPAISCKRWIPSANAWLAEHSHWPNKKLKQETAELDGIVLVGKSALKKSAYQWRVTFPMPTRRLVQADMGCRNKCLSAIEIILDNARYVPRGVDQCHFKISDPASKQEVPRAGILGGGQVRPAFYGSAALFAALPDRQAVG